MISDTLDRPTNGGIGRAAAFVRQHAIIIVAVLLFLIPTFYRMATQAWSTEAGAHAPIVLATGVWLLSQGDFSTASPTEKSRHATVGFWLFIALEVVALAAYTFARAYDFLSVEAAAAYGAVLAIAAAFVGLAPLRRNAFPLFYLCFLIPLPGWVIDRTTAPLQQFISYSATSLLQMFDYPVMRSGVTIYIAQYQLLVEQACSGMNSIIGLISVTLFYIYILHRSSWRYAALLVLLILPIAIFANFIRVVVLILLTYHYGDAVAQGFLHNTAGIALFAMALFMMIAIDALLQRTLFRKGPPA